MIAHKRAGYLVLYEIIYMYRVPELIGCFSIFSTSPIIFQRDDLGL